MLYLDKEKIIITEVLVVANRQKMISIQQVKDLLIPYELERYHRDFLILEILDMISEYKEIKLVVHEYLILNCETLAQ